MFTPEFFENPHPFFDGLRRADPVHFSPEMGVWLLTRHADVVAAFRDHRRFSSAWPGPFIDQLPEAARATLAQLRRAATHIILFKDPPDHTRLRSLMSKAFTPRIVEGMRPGIQAVVDELLDAVEPAGRMDAVRQFAHPLPLEVIAAMLGLSREDHPMIKEASDHLAAFFGAPRPNPELGVKAQKGILALMERFRAVADERRRAPKDDLFGALVDAHEGEDRITEEELLSNAANLLFGGHETTTNLVANGLLAFIRNPDQKRLLEEDPSLIVGAVEECLRYAAPAQIMPRLAVADVELGGKTIRRGQMVLVAIGAANHDPEQFPDPHRFDIKRSTAGQVAFATGAHACLGAPMARVEVQIAIGTVLRRFPRIRLDETPPEWHHVPSLRGMKSMPVVLS